MNYVRDFTIGKRETLDFYLTQELSRWWKGILAFGAVGAVAALAYTSQKNYQPIIIAAAALGSMAVFAALCALWRIVGIHIQVGGRIRRSGKGSYVQHVEIDGFGVHVTVEKNKARVPFEKLLRVRETGKAFYIYLAEGQAWILPKKQMGDPAGESRALRETFRRVIPSGQLKIRK